MKNATRQAVLSGYYTCSQVMKLLGMSRAKAYETIKEMNEELKKKGYRPFKPGTISRKYFHERYYCDFDLSVLDEPKGGVKDEKRAV